MRYIHNATYWIAGPRDPFGAPTWQAPVQTRVRWEDRSRLYIDNEGRQVRSEATVYVQNYVPIGSYILRGVSVSPDPPDEAREVKDYREIDNLRGTRTERRLML